MENSPVFWGEKTYLLEPMATVVGFEMGMLGTGKLP